MEGKKENSEDFGVFSASFFSQFAVEEEENNAVADFDSKEPQMSDGPLRSPICCMLGHAYIGKTKLLDYIRGGGTDARYVTTQWNSATYIPSENLRRKTNEFKPHANINVPGLLFLDTPGLTSFKNLISQGLALCDVAILVVDIIVGLQPQTTQSLQLLKMFNKKFIVALNQVDLLSGWKSCHNAPFAKAYKQQSMHAQNVFNVKLNQIIAQFKQHGIDTKIYYQNNEMEEIVSIVPTSAVSGEGISDMLLLLVMWTQKTMVDKLRYKEELQCAVLDVSFVERRGTTMNVVLVNGALHEGDRIVVCGKKRNYLSSIQSIWAPSPMKELGDQGNYFRHRKIRGVMAIKIVAQGLEDAIDDTDLYVVKLVDDSKDVEETILEDKKQHD